MHSDNPDVSPALVMLLGVVLPMLGGALLVVLLILMGVQKIRQMRQGKTEEHGTAGRDGRG